MLWPDFYEQLGASNEQLVRLPIESQLNKIWIVWLVMTTLAVSYKQHWLGYGQQILSGMEALPLG